MKRQKFTIPGILVAFLIGMLFMGGICYSLFSPEKSQAANIREKRVVSVMVEEEDTIWTIARRYYTEECGSIKNYISEIKKCNSLDSDTIYAGYPLIVPVWVSDEEADANGL